MKTTLLLMGASALLCARPINAADYWPMPEVFTYHYETVSGDQLDVTYHGEERRCDYHGLWPCQTEERFGISDDGDVTISFAYGYCGAMDPEYYCYFVPPRIFLDLPLEVGKVWSADADGSGFCPQVVYEVTDYLFVRVPAGDFWAMEVVERIQGWPGPDRTYYLERRVGPVILPGGYRLIWFAPIVQTQDATWGSVKALYR